MITGFEDALVRAYRESPCAVLPNALWKTLQALEAPGVVTSYDLDPGRGAVNCLLARDDQHLWVCWTRDGQLPPEIDAATIGQMRLALLHARYVAQLSTERSPASERYFRLVHRSAPDRHPLPAGFAFREVDPLREAGTVAALISRCYPDLELSPATVAAWTRHPVYAADLWVWIVEGATGTRVALGIAELDEDVPEASLEWIQVLPAYHRRGIGTALVGELLARIEGRVAFTSVSGRVDSATNPEALYRRCGFTGDDIWWVLRRPAD
ncbi:MAG: GNAT family N-acetyltransferase [Anaerolineae bacterium]